MQMRRLRIIAEKLKDKRSSRVIFLSHCILNENTRYFGGAFKGAVMHEVLVKLHELNAGIVQMRCPEQMAWGGVQKRFIWRALGGKGRLLYRLRGMILPVFIVVTRCVYRRLARNVVRDIVDYQNAEAEIVGVIGVDGSPSCGVLKHMKIDCALEVLAGLNTDNMNARDFNEQLYSRCLDHGHGIFFDELKKELSRKKIHVQFYSLDIVKEMQGKKHEISFIHDSITH